MENFNFLNNNYFLQMSVIYLVGNQKISERSSMKLLRERLANVSSLPDINRVVIFILFNFFTAKDLMLADSLSLNSTTTLVFLGSRQSIIFSSASLNLPFSIFFFFFCKNPECPIPPPFVFHNIFF